MREKLSEVKRALLANLSPPPPNPPPGESPGTGPGQKSEPAQEITKEMVANILELPFTLSRLVTGFQGFQINPLIKENVMESGYQACKDFGIEIFSKWVNLAVFVGLYGACGVGAMSGYLNAVKTRKQQEVPDEKKPDSSPPGPKS